MNSTSRRSRKKSSPRNNGNGSIILDRKALKTILEDASSYDAVTLLRAPILELKHSISSTSAQLAPLVPVAEGHEIQLDREVLLSELDQILSARTTERARHYIKRLQRGIEEEKTGSINDINLHRWKEYGDIITDSLWNLPKRDTAGEHLGWYWGNFIPQIPHQLMLRYTKRNDWVLDPFLGSGTTLIECRRLGRNGLGVELNKDAADKARQLIEREPNRFAVSTSILVADSRYEDLGRALSALQAKSVQFAILHPPYHDIISFSEDNADLSNAEDIRGFLEMFGQVVDNTARVLDNRRYLAVVIGDKYEGGEWIPLGFMCMAEVLKRDFALKSIIVKNFDQTRAKREQRQLWRYRALVGGFYIFKHEYILLFKKR